METYVACFHNTVAQKNCDHPDHLPVSGGGAAPWIKVFQAVVGTRVFESSGVMGSNGEGGGGGGG